MFLIYFLFHAKLNKVLLEILCAVEKSVIYTKCTYIVSECFELY